MVSKFNENAKLVSCLQNVLPQPELLISHATSSFLVNLNILFPTSFNVGWWVLKSALRDFNKNWALSSALRDFKWWALKSALRDFKWWAFKSSFRDFNKSWALKSALRDFKRNFWLSK